MPLNEVKYTITVRDETGRRYQEEIDAQTFSTITLPNQNPAFLPVGDLTPQAITLPSGVKGDVLFVKAQFAQELTPEENRAVTRIY